MCHDQADVPRGIRQIEDEGAREAPTGRQLSIQWFTTQPILIEDTLKRLVKVKPVVPAVEQICVRARCALGAAHLLTRPARDEHAGYRARHASCSGL